MKLGYFATAAVAAFALASPSFAIDKGGPIVIDPISNSGSFGASHGTPETTFTDNYTFTTTLSGSAAAALISITFSAANYLSFTSLTLNGATTTTFTTSNPAPGMTQYTAVVMAPVNPLPGTNTLKVVGSVVGAGGSYGGNLTLTAAVPEAATWAMMVIGFGAVGGALRTSRRKVVFA